jgi:hypothetical protein
VLDVASGALVRVLKPPTPGANASNLLVGDGEIYESVSRKLPGGKFGPPTLLAFGA